MVKAVSLGAKKNRLGEALNGTALVKSGTGSRPCSPRPEYQLYRYGYDGGEERRWSCNGQSHCMEFYDQRRRVYGTDASAPWRSRYFRDFDQIGNHRRFSICYQWGYWS